MIGGNLFIAAAIGAERFTERQVDLQADAVHMVLLPEFNPEIFLPTLPVQRLVPVRNGRITGVPRDRQIVFL